MLSVPVPDVDRTDHLLILGANPLRVERQPADRARHARPAARASASAAARSWSSTRAARAPPRRPTSTTSSGPAPTRCCSRPWPARWSRRTWSTRAARRARRRARRGARRSCATSRPSAVAGACGIDGRARSGGMARELAGAPSAPPCTRRIGTCTQEFGTLASWLVDVLNVLTGNLDREGGAMFPLAAAGAAQHVRHARQRQRRAHRALAQPRARARPRPRRAAGRRASPRRSTRPARARCARSSRSPATRCCRRRTPTGSSAALERPRLHAGASTSTSTRPPATPT